VLALAGAYPKLSETFVRRQVEALAAAGHRVTVLAEQRSDPTDRSLPVPPGVRVRHLPPRPPHRGLRRAQAAWTSLRAFVREPRATIRILRSPSTPHERWLTLSTLLAVLDLRGDIDVVHAHFGWFGARIVDVRRALAWQVPVATAFHGIDITVHLRRAGVHVYDRLLADGELFLPVSEHWRQRLLSLGASADRVEVHHMGVDVGTLVYAPGTTATELRVISIGRLVEKKGFDDGLAAVAVARRRGAALSWTVVGDGPLEGHLRARCRELDLDEHVRFVGAMTHEEALTLLAAHDVILCPSRTATDGDQEGIPVVLMEAMAVGTVAVATRHSGIPELVEHDRTGLLADEGDATELGRHLTTLARDPDRGTRFACAGRRHVEEAFDGRSLDVALEARLRRLARNPSVARP
jgi:colanic acid/amylovoran biosynthesis glycosyltransferase